jgi:glutamyl-tRNA(Gln) amidotransferase subunit D
MPYSEKVQKVLDYIGAQIGDKLRLLKEDVEIVGYLMPREEVDFGDSDVLVLKLDNGYNVGIRLDESTTVERLQERVSLGVFPSLREVEQDTTLPSISIISTGGTISSRVDYMTGAVAWHISPQELLFGVPELLKIVHLRNVLMPFRLASEDMSPLEWIFLAKKVVKLISEGDSGVVILHGTDTMHYTAAALSFMVRGINVPVVLTGAQRSSDRASRDSDLNIIGASIAASRMNAALVAIAMHGTPSDEYVTLIRGTRARKMHTSRRDAFRSINEPPIGRVWLDGKIELFSDLIKPRSKDPPWYDAVFEEKIAIIKTYPGSNPELLDLLVDRGYRGVVIEGTGLGHVPTLTLDDSKSWLPKIERALHEDVVVCITSQCINGRTDPYVYRNGRILLKAGALFLQDMLTEVAYVKLGWLLGHDFDTQSVKAMMLHNFAGELGTRETYETFP